MINKVTEGRGFYISYMVADSGSGSIGDETALVHKLKKSKKIGKGKFSIIKKREFFILNGDWQEQYKKLIPKGYRACKKFFDSKKKKHINFWSE